MNRTIPNQRPFGLLAACGLACCFATLAFGQARQDPPKDDPMRGPEVRDRQVPGVRGSFGEGGERKRAANEARIPPRVFKDAMETIMAEDAPADIRVSDEQRERFQDMIDNFQKSFNDYMKQHPELRDMRRKGGDGGARRPSAGGPDAQRPPKGPDGEMRPDAKPDSRPDGDAGDASAARERYQTIMAGAPKIEDVYTKIWAELKPGQQKAVDAKLDDFRAQQAKQREDNYVRQRAKKDGKDPQAPDARPKRPGEPQPPAGDNAPPAPKRRGATDRAPDGQPAPDGQREARRPQQVDPQRRERLMRVFSQLTPEQQDQILDRLERMREDGNFPPAGRPGRRGGPQGPGDRKPAPEPDDSMMPPPPQR